MLAVQPAGAPIMKLHGHPESGHAYKVRLYLALSGIEHDYEVVDIGLPRDARPVAFREASRFGEVPCLIDAGQARVQSNAILLHLQDAYGPAIDTTDDAGLDAGRRALVTEWLFWEANKIGLCLPQLRSARHFNDTSYNPGALEWLQARYDSDVARMADELADGRAFILGDELSVADCSLCGYLYFADQARVVVPDAVAAWLERIAALPGWAHPYELMAG